MGMHVSHSIKLNIYQVNLVLDVFKILLFKGFVMEDEFASSFFKDGFAKTVEVVIIKISTENVLINPLTELNNSLEFLAGDVVLLGVSLSHHEHLVILLPEGDEVGVLLNDQINNIQGSQDLSEVVEDFMVDHFLETIQVHSILRVKKSIHLIHYVFRQINNSPDNIEELIVYF